jgi:hypothetical protein
MAIWAQQVQVSLAVIGITTIHVMYLQWNISGEQIHFAPSALGAFVVKLNSQVLDDLLGGSVTTHYPVHLAGLPPQDVAPVQILCLAFYRAIFTIVMRSWLIARQARTNFPTPWMRLTISCNPFVVARSST